MSFAFLDEQQIPYEIRRSKRAKKQKITIFPTYVEIVIPDRLSDRWIRSFVEKEQKWIINNWLKHGNKKYAYSLPDEFISGAKLPFLGKMHEFEIQKSDCLVAKLIFVENRFLLLHSQYLKNPDFPLLAKKLYTEFLRNELTNIIELTLADLASKTELKATSFRLKKQKGRWGSCSTKGNININVSLIFAPREVIEYVIIHEFCHLKHKNHAPVFWQMVKSLCPNYSAHKKWLRSNPQIIDFEV